MGGILVLPAGREAVVGSYAGASAVNFHSAVSDFQVYGLAGILVRAGLAIVFKHDMEINVHFPAVDPCGNLVRNSGQGMEEGLFIQISFITAALTFLETAMIERIELLGNCCF